MPKIYLDNNSTTQIDPDVFRSMSPFFDKYFGNPNSLHLFGDEPLPAIDKSCDQLYSCLNALDDDTILITSGATESINTVHRHILHLFLTQKSPKNQIITSPMEHPAVQQSLLYLKNFGIEIITLPLVDHSISLEHFIKYYNPDQTLLVSMMLASNETGVILPLNEILKHTTPHKTLFHTDATQYVGKIPINLQKFPIDFLSFSGHKFHGPKGVGGLFVRKNIALTPLLHGGSQMGGLRSGTLNTPLIVGLGEALNIATQNLDSIQQHVLSLRNQLEEFLLSIPETLIYGKSHNRIPNTTFVNIPSIDRDYLVWHLNQNSIATSTGSACASHALQPLTVESIDTNKGVRISLSKFTTENEIIKTIDCIKQLL